MHQLSSNGRGVIQQGVEAKGIASKGAGRDCPSPFLKGGDMRCTKYVYYHVAKGESCLIVREEVTKHYRVTTEYYGWKGALSSIPEENSRVVIHVVEDWRRLR